MSIRRGEGRPKSYKINGKRVDSVTGITGRWKDSGGLLAWQYMCGADDAKSHLIMRAQDLLSDEDIEILTSFNIERSDLPGHNHRMRAGGKTGGLAHDWIEALIHDEPFALPDDVESSDEEKVFRCVNSFKRWRALRNPEFVATELPLTYEICEGIGFAGTPDAVAVIDGKRELVDWKTSKGTFIDHVYQVSAYGLMWNRAFPDEPIEGYRILRMDKDESEFDELVFDAETGERYGKQFIEMARLKHTEKALVKEFKKMMKEQTEMKETKEATE